MSKTRKARKRRNSGCLLIPLCMLLFPVGAAGSQELVYKEPREKKALPDGAQESSGAGNTPGQIAILRAPYNPEGKTDPFKSFIAEQEAVEEKKKRKPRTYLETLDLSQLELVATVIETRGNWAMVRDAKGLGHVIKVGTPIGTSEGVVAVIEEGEVVIKEKHTDFRGQELVKEIKKKLPSPD